MATGAVVIPAHYGTPDPFIGRMKGKDMEPELIRFIDRLREAAKEYGAVADLLRILDESLLLDDMGNRQIIGNDEDVEWLRAALMAAQFVAYDRSGDNPESQD
ncbi:hypothetical protein N5K27_22540 [Pigmentiphaga sp. GD03639]|uniref:hypothetical protein n=1 Tax=Pigmentiphaga sp. GD03639 TaxID=2975354 RepID=UPI00244BCAA3|nr:hypothetical protein [Pigmentiphaga sp. GD03639]MDH2239091.1 hypothetical protein [Pigmentiphaga sp. GD03639]